MNLFALCVAALTALYGLVTLLRQKTPLFYQIVVFSSWCYLLAVLYRVLYAMFIPTPAFHAGYLAYAGTFFFLLSACFSGRKRPSKRAAALLPPLVIAAWGLLNVARGHGVLPHLLLLPVLPTAYVSCGALLDRETAGLRPYHGVILSLCLLQPVMLVAMLTREHTALPILLTSVLSAAAVPLAHRGCRV